MQAFVDVIATGDDPWELLRTAVQLDRSLFEHCGDIIASVRGAAEVEPEFAGVYAEGQRRHTAGTTFLADRLAAMGALRDEVDPAAAAGIIGMYAATRRSACSRTTTAGRSTSARSGSPPNSATYCSAPAADRAAGDV